MNLKSKDSFKKLIVVGGPTASGKTGLSLQLAEKFDAAILSADSRQLYKHLNIGTAKPSVEELATARHHFIDMLELEEDFSAGDFERRALSILAAEFESSDFCILVGGTGLYIKAVCEGLDHFPKVAIEDRNFYTKKLDDLGIASLQEELKIKDPEYAAIVDLNNPHRLIRALSIISSTGRSFSSFHTAKPVQRFFLNIKIALLPPREVLYKRINARVDSMISRGLVKEARSVYPYRNYNSVNTVGYKELFEYFEGKVTLDHAVDKIKQHSRNYAKRQYTWFSNQGDWKSFESGQIDQIQEYIRSF